MSARAWLALLLGVVALNFVLTFHNVWPTFWITTRYELSVEIAVLIASMAAYRGLVGPLSPRMLDLAAVVLVLLCIGRYAEVTAPALYGRRINVYWDARHLPGLVAMFGRAAPAWLLAVAGLGIAGILLGVFAAVRWSLGRVHGAFAFAMPRHALGALAAGLVVVYALGYPPVSLQSWRWFSIPVTTTYWRQAAFVREAMDDNVTASKLPPARSLDGYGLERAGGADVIVMFVESYGATAFDAPAVSSRVARHRAAFDDAIRASGRGAVSAFVESPTFGGASWLAHSSFMTGLPIDDNGVYQLLLTQDRETLGDVFARAGYRIAALLPGLRSAWPEGAFYDFATIYDAQTLGYPGPDFGWWRIPDQYALAKADALEIEPDARQPVLLFFATISTHLPFKPTPPYQPDWARLLSAKPYAGTGASERLEETPQWTDMRPAYADTLIYTYEYLSGYLQQRRGRDLILIVLGDHQPAANVSGEDARWDVPVHVIASRGEILDALLDAGFSPGLEPDAAPLAPMHELTGLVLEAFSACRGGPRPGPRGC